MQIVTDQGMDLSAQQLEGLVIHKVPLRVSLGGKTYQGSDLNYADFYRMLSKTGEFPVTSQPSPGDFAVLYRKLAAVDPEILSIHISSGLSGTINSARAAAEMVPEAKVTILDSKTLSLSLGWQVEAAGRAIKLGLPYKSVLRVVEDVRSATDTMFTLSDLKYLIHGGRISHVKGLMGSLLNIKPIIGVSKEDGKYYPLAQEFTFKKAINKLADLTLEKYPHGEALRVQIVHGDNPEGVALLQERMRSNFDCAFEEVLPVAPVLGAHTGPSVIGMGVAPLQLFLLPELSRHSPAIASR